jgi:hypothetical protein
MSDLSACSAVVLSSFRFLEEPSKACHSQTKSRLAPLLSDMEMEGQKGWFGTVL